MRSHRLTSILLPQPLPLPSSFRPRCVALVAALLAIQGAVAKDVEWMGRDPYEPYGLFPDHASFNDAASWFGYVAPGLGDDAMFRVTAPTGEFVASTQVHFGSFTRRVGIGEYFSLPAQDAVIRSAHVQDGRYVFDLGGFTEAGGEAVEQGSLRLNAQWEGLVVGETTRIYTSPYVWTSTAGNASLALRGGTVFGQFTVGKGSGNVGFLDVTADAVVDARDAQYDISHLGDGGTGTLNVEGTVLDRALWLGDGSGEGRMNVDGGSMTLSQELAVGEHAYGNVVLTNSAFLGAREIELGGKWEHSGAYGEIRVVDSRIEAVNRISVGLWDTGSLSVLGASQVATKSMFIGQVESSYGEVNVAGGSVTVSDGLDLGRNAGSYGSLVLDGPDSSLHAGWVYGGLNGGESHIEVSRGASFETGFAQFGGPAGSGSIVIDGSRANIGTLYLANDGNYGQATPTGEASLALENGATYLGTEIQVGKHDYDASYGSLKVQNSTLRLVDLVDGRGFLDVQGQSSLLFDRADVSVGSRLSLGVAPMADVSAIVKGGSTVTTGFMRVGGDNGKGELTVDGASRIRAGFLQVGGTDPDSYGRVELLGGSSVEVQADDGSAGLWILTDDVFDVTDGAARVGDASWVDGAVTVGAGGTVRGDGTIVGDLIVQEGGMVSPGNSPGTLHIDGDVVLDGSLNMEVVQTSTDLLFDQILATGRITLGGTLNLSVSGFTGTQTFQMFGGSDVLGSFDTINVTRGYVFSLNGDSATVQAVPEPASLAALGFGALALIRRRRR